ncbi:DUF3768 domain-containing protein [Methylobacterium terricola]|uniref:DUF3768 domain-containing protein n=2 Tax=Methylobacterium terricola TaxID=2583531 RepID=A0A5C4L736_9HYPH|nr:DUF3768 domain-containing protein [Methylobacterium terricola]TNC07665.1 DUF3768 domain-containing protein [Methylobacterium terricola]
MNKQSDLHEIESPSAAAHRGTIQQLNDALRGTGQGGRLVLTPGVRALGPERVAALVAAVAAFDAFTPENDPYGEHDFGAVEVNGDRYYWKIDYYGRQSSGHSFDPANAEVTLRVLTIMLIAEY